METYINRLRERQAIAAGTEKEVERQHSKGRLTARERIELLFDPDTFNEIDTLVTPRSEEYMDGRSSRYGDGVITGFGLVNGRRVFVASQNAGVMGGSLGEMHANKIVKAMNMAIKYGCPFIALNDSGGARIQEGVDSLGGYARIFDANCEASGRHPADFGHSGSVCRRRRLLAGPDRLRLHDRKQLYVHHRARSGPCGHAGEREPGRTGRRSGA